MSTLNILILVSLYIAFTGLTKWVYSDFRDLSDKVTTSIGIIWPITFPLAILVFAVMFLVFLINAIIILPILYIVNPFLPSKWRQKIYE
jgi:hypothetical protein